MLVFLYENVLSRYSEFQTRVDVALETGTYNCVSSAVLYYYFARVAGLDVAGVETPVHSFCTVAIPGEGRKIDVETTNPYGFDPGVRRELATGDPNEKRYAVVPQTNYLSRKSVGERRLVSLIYNNRITLLEKSGQSWEAVGLALDAWTLQGTEASRGDLAERCLNYATGLVSAGKALEALDFIRMVSEKWGDYPRYREFSASALGPTLNGLMAQGAWTDAFALMTARGPDLAPAVAREMGELVAANYLADYALTHTLAESLAETERNRDALSAADYAKVIAYAYSRAVESLARNGDWLGASALADEGLAVVPGRAELLRARAAYRQNYAIEAHNRAAAAFNSGDAAGAKAILEEALRAVPENATLKADLSRLK